jgi:hypothetical protein
MRKCVFACGVFAHTKVTIVIQTITLEGKSARFHSDNLWGLKRMGVIF